MAFTKVHHIGILVDELEVGRHVFCDGWGLAVNEHHSPWPDGRPGTIDGTTSIEIPIGEMYLEISAPDGDTGPAAEFVADRRAGMYWIALASSDLAADVAMLQANGVATEGEWDGGERRLPRPRRHARPAHPDHRRGRLLHPPALPRHGHPHRHGPRRDRRALDGRDPRPLRRQVRPRRRPLRGARPR